MNDPLSLQIFTQEYIDENTQSLRTINKEVSDRNAVKFKEFQDWARTDSEAKGYVEVDDVYIAKRILLRQAVTWDGSTGRGHGQG